MDDFWPRTISLVDEELDKWLAGELHSMEVVWSIWGYHLPADIANQYVVADPCGIIAGWKERLTTYPTALKKAIIDKHLGSLLYWRDDYHYSNKVVRGDVVFLAGLSARLVHDIVQVLFALNEVYFVGDGSNLDYARKFTTIPDRFADRVMEILYPPLVDGMFEKQRQTIVDLINDVETLSAHP